MRAKARWCLLVPGAFLGSLTVYYVVGAALAFAAVSLLGKSYTVDISLGIALHYQHWYFALVSAILAVVSVGVEASAWRRWGLAAVALMIALSVIYWVAMTRYAPKWAILVLTSTAAGLTVPPLLARAMTRARGLARR